MENGYGEFVIYNVQRTEEGEWRLRPSLAGSFWTEDNAYGWYQREVENSKQYLKRFVKEPVSDTVQEEG
jgi:hypothetical protein